jgi:hypothetical protein
MSGLSVPTKRLEIINKNAVGTDKPDRITVDKEG